MLVGLENKRPYSDRHEYSYAVCTVFPAGKKAFVSNGGGGLVPPRFYVPGDQDQRRILGASFLKQYGPVDIISMLAVL
jgi:hypothetical protein